MRYAAHPLAVLSLTLALAILTGCAKPPAARPEAPPAPVTVTTAGKKTVPVRLRTIGAVKTLATVAVRPRVGGEITCVYFKEGDSVTRGQELFAIDHRPYEAAVKQAEANRAKNAAVLAGAKVELTRVKMLIDSGVGSTTDYDAASTAVASAKAAVEADEVTIRTAKLQLSYTVITAPIEGRVGELLVSRGNLVDANGLNPLVVINQVNPITVAFTIPEHQRLNVIEAQKKGPLKVEAAYRMEDQEKAPPKGETRRSGEPLAVGELTFTDNATDTLTGTLLCKATFENADERLWSGLFVDVTLTLGNRPDSVVVPSAALQSGQEGQYVYVVTPDKKAERKNVTVAFEADGEAIIASGLSGGETVVVEGQLRLAPGLKVDPRPVGKTGAPASPAPGVVIEGAK